MADKKDTYFKMQIALHSDPPKICFWVGNTGYHFTLIFRTNNKQFDLHKTSDSDPDDQETIFKMDFALYNKFNDEIKDIGFTLYQKYWFNQRITIAKLIRCNAFIIPFYPSEGGKDFFKISRKEKHFEFKKPQPEKILSLIRGPKYAVTSESELFEVYFRKRGKPQFWGMLLKGNNHKDFSFISEKRLSLLKEALRKEIISTLQRIESGNNEKSLLNLILKKST